MKLFLKAIVLISLFAVGCSQDSAPKNDTDKQPEKEQVLNVYTHRHYESDQKLFAEFTEQTGIKVNVTNAKADELINKMQTEGELSPADVLITVDAGRLVRAKEKGLLQSVTSKNLENKIPAKYRDEGGHWFGLTKRARVFIYNPEVMSEDDFSTYQDLTDEKWNGDIVVRSSGNIYNQSMMASIIANSSVEEATDWAKGVVTNMARTPKGNDRDQIKAVYHGDAKVAIANTYYMGKMINSSDSSEVEIGNAMKIFFPNQSSTGTHVNVSGAGVAKYAPNKDNAVKFLEFLASAKSQEAFSSGNYEYPVNPEAKTSELLMSWGEFKEDKLNLAILGELNKQAVQAFDAAGWK